MSTQLPKQFADLERFDAWILATSTERNRKRLASSMDEINSFYETMMSRIDDILAYLDQFSLDEMPQEAKSLMLMTLSLAEVSNAVELFHEPRVTGGCDPSRFVVAREPNP